jgi:hypothetical protein
MSIASIGEAVENPSVTQLLAAYPTKEAFDAGVQAGKIKPTTEAGVAANIFNRIVQSALANQAQTQAQTTVFQENTQPMGQKMGLGAIAPGGQPQAPQQMPQGQGLDQVPVPPEMFDEQRMAGGGIVAFQPGGVVPSFANMYSGLDTDISALRNVLGAYPTETAEEKARRRKEEQAYRLMEIGLGIAGGGSEHFSENLKGALPGLRGAAEDIRAQRKENVALQMAQRAETGKLLEGVLGTRGKAAEAAAADARSKADREAKIIAAGIANQKPTDMQRFADLTVRASKGDKEAQLMVNAIKNEYLPAIGTSGLRAQAAITSAQAGAEGKVLGAYNETRALVERMLGPLGTDKALRKEYRDIKDPVKREAFVDNLVQKEMARAKAATEAFTTKGQPGAAPATPPKKPEISGVTGAPEGSSIGQFVSGKGWEVRDKSGKVIGYAQQ